MHSVSRAKTILWPAARNVPRDAPSKELKVVYVPFLRKTSRNVPARRTSSPWLIISARLRRAVHVPYGAVAGAASATTEPDTTTSAEAITAPYLIHSSFP